VKRVQIAMGDSTALEELAKTFSGLATDEAGALSVIRLLEDACKLESINKEDASRSETGTQNEASIVKEASQVENKSRNKKSQKRKSNVATDKASVSANTNKQTPCGTDTEQLLKRKKPADSLTNLGEGINKLQKRGSSSSHVLNPGTLDRERRSTALQNKDINGAEKKIEGSLFKRKHRPKESSGIAQKRKSNDSSHDAKSQKRKNIASHSSSGSVDWSPKTTEASEKVISLLQSGLKDLNFAPPLDGTLDESPPSKPNERPGQKRVKASGVNPIPDTPDVESAVRPISYVQLGQSIGLESVTKPIDCSRKRPKPSAITTNGLHNNQSSGLKLHDELQRATQCLSQVHLGQFPTVPKRTRSARSLSAGKKRKKSTTLENKHCYMQIMGINHYKLGGPDASRTRNPILSSKKCLHAGKHKRVAQVVLCEECATVVEKGGVFLAYNVCLRGALSKPKGPALKTTGLDSQPDLKKTSKTLANVTKEHNAEELTNPAMLGKMAADLPQDVGEDYSQVNELSYKSMSKSRSVKWEHLEKNPGKTTPAILGCFVRVNQADSLRARGWETWLLHPDCAGLPLKDLGKNSVRPVLEGMCLSLDKTNRKREASKVTRNRRNFAKKMEYKIDTLTSELTLKLDVAEAQKLGINDSIKNILLRVFKNPLATYFRRELSRK